MRLFLIICAAIIFWPVVMFGGGAALLGVTATAGNMSQGAWIAFGLAVLFGMAMQKRKQAEISRAAEIKRLQEMDPEWRARELERLQSRKKSPLNFGGK